MACTTQFIETLCDLLTPLGDVSSRKMMGDYVIYVNGKCVITACDNNAFIKKLPCLAPIMADAETGSPYPGAKEAYILNLDNEAQTLKAVAMLWGKLPGRRGKK